MCNIYEWDAWARKTIPVPMVVGHEFYGEVVEVGSNVADFHPGEIVFPGKSCCVWSLSQSQTVCCRSPYCGAHTQGIGVNRPGAFAEYIALPLTTVWHHAGQY